MTILKINQIKIIKKKFRDSSIIPYLYILLKSNIKIKEVIRNIKGYSIIKKTKLFNKKYYLKKYPNLKESFISPLIHYIYYGFHENKNPSKNFSGLYYLHKYPDVKKSNINPLIHYVLYGKSEKRLANKYEAIKVTHPSKQKISIKIAAPESKKNKWGDYHFAKSLKKNFEKIGYTVNIHTIEMWNNNDFDTNIVIVLRGLKKYSPKHYNYNIMWNISHPDLIKIPEYNSYDLVLIASETYAEIIETKINTSVYPLLQCTDPEIFYPEYTEECENRILFVGNTRGVFRKIIKDILKTKHDFSVYGPGWDKFISSKYIKKNYIKNEKLFKAYSSCEILLNDHWEDMSANGFISNRIFDGLASKAFIISDEVNGLKNIFEDNIITYSNHKDLDEKIKYFLNNPHERREKAEKGHIVVLKHHTFKNRSEKIINLIKKEILLKKI